MRKAFVLAVAALVVPTLAVAGGQSMSPVVSAKLKGASEAGIKGDPDGKGLAIVHFNTTKGTTCWNIKGVTGIGKPNAAHIHKGGKGVAGPVKAPKSTIEKIESSPNAYYVNIHNAKYPAGAVRGQLVAGMEG